MKNECIARLTEAGIKFYDAVQLRRIAMTLHRWHELECGDDFGCIERDEITNKTYMLNAMSGKRYKIYDRETGALKRLDKIMTQYPDFVSYVQGDPRGASLYIVSKADLNGFNIEQVYNRGLAVYK